MMKFFLRSKKLKSVLCTCFMLAGLLFSVTPAGAAERTGSITLDYELSDTTFRLYKVAAIDESGTPVLTADFAESQADLTDENNFKTAASALESYVNSNQLTAQDTQKSNENGRLTFDKLVKGIYLVLGDIGKVGNATYTPSPVLLSVPQNTEDNTEKWYVTAELKFGLKKDTGSGGGGGNGGGGGTGGGGGGGSTDDTIGDDVTDIVNSGNDGEDEGDDVDLVHSPLPDDSTTDISTDTVTTVNSPQLSSGLPKTGQLWWPVPALSAAGLCFITAGLRRRRNK
jgi:hypothetical protein